MKYKSGKRKQRERQKQGEEEKGLWLKEDIESQSGRRWERTKVEREERGVCACAGMKEKMRKKSSRRKRCVWGRKWERIEKEREKRCEWGRRWERNKEGEERGECDWVSKMRKISRERERIKKETE